MGPRHFAARSGVPGLVLLLAACALPGELPPPADATACVAPRPEVCTMEYRPVCGLHEAGSSRTYSNACSACADPGVVAHTAGTCAE